jgi:tetratricopeptide (TPR) repeat protein
MLIVGGQTQICDLGLARILDDTRQTRAAFSVAYGAPECLAGSSPSPGTDQYSLAVSYVELRTGQLPFEDTSSHARVIQAHLDSRLDLSRLSARERAVIRRATQLDPADRFESVTAMVTALRSAVTNDRGPRTGDRRRKNRPVLVAAVLVGVILSGLVVWKSIPLDEVFSEIVGVQARPFVPPHRTNEQPFVANPIAIEPSNSVQAFESLSNEAAESPNAKVQKLAEDPIPAEHLKNETQPTYLVRWLGRKTTRAIGSGQNQAQSAESALLAFVTTLRATAIQFAFAQGVNAAKAGDDRIAIQRFGMVLAYDHRHVPSHIQRGLSFARLEKLDEAIRDYSLALDVDPNQADARRLRGIAFARQGKWVDSLHDLDVAIQKNAEPSSVCYRTRALVRLRLEDYVGALADHERFKSLDSRVMLLLPLRVARKDAFVEFDTGENSPIEIGKSLKLLEVKDQRLHVEYRADDKTRTGWIHQSFVTPSVRL